MTAAFRYEFRMQITRPVLWIVFALAFLSADGKQAEFGLFWQGTTSYVFDPEPGGAFGFLRPEPTPATAVLWIALMVALAVALLALARLHTARTEA